MRIDKEKIKKGLKNPKKIIKGLKNLLKIMWREKSGLFIRKYNFSHLTQEKKQRVIGPIQDDEALFLYSLIRVMRLKRILEIGGLEGYSAKNFLRALDYEDKEEHVVYTVDVEPLKRIEKRHKVIIKDAKFVNKNDLDNKPIDLLFFDCHCYEAEMQLYKRLKKEKIITEETVIVLHDTGLHDEKYVPWAYKIDEGYVHVNVERRIVNELRKEGYQIFNIHKLKRDKSLPFSHGLTICQKNKEFKL